VANGFTPKYRSPFRERAIAEIQYRTPDGRVQRQTMTEKQISIIPAGQPYQFSWPRGADLTVARIAPDFLKRAARACGMRAVEVVGQYGAFDPVLWHLGRELRAELRRHRKLDSTYLHSVATVLTRYLISTYVTAVLPLPNSTTKVLHRSCRPWRTSERLGQSTRPHRLR